jgi:hypothetical protein
MKFPPRCFRGNPIPYSLVRIHCQANNSHTCVFLHVKFLVRRFRCDPIAYSLARILAQTNKSYASFSL